MYLTPINNVIYFRAKTTDDNKDKKKVSKEEVAVATGATGGGIKAFTETNRKIHTATKNVKNGVELATETTNKAKGILGKFTQNCKHYKNSIIEFGQNVTKSKYLKPILESSAYKGFAGFAGGVTAGLVAISGVGEMTNTFARKAQQFTED